MSVRVSLFNSSKAALAGSESTSLLSVTTGDSMGASSPCAAVTTFLGVTEVLLKDGVTLSGSLDVLVWVVLGAVTSLGLSLGAILCTMLGASSNEGKTTQTHKHVNHHQYSTLCAHQNKQIVKNVIDPGLLTSFFKARAPRHFLLGKRNYLLELFKGTKTMTRGYRGNRLHYCLDEVSGLLIMQHQRQPDYSAF